MIVDFVVPPIPLGKAEIKTLVRYRDGYSCTECGMTAAEHFAEYGRNLEVHRIIPGSEYSFEGCVTLCRPCHKDKPKSPRGKRSNRLVRVKERIIAQVRLLAAERETDLTQMINDLVIESLERRGFWPPGGKESSD